MFILSVQKRCDHDELGRVRKPPSPAFASAIHGAQNGRMDTSELSVKLVRGQRSSWVIDLGARSAIGEASPVAFGIWLASLRGLDQTTIVFDCEANRIVSETQHNADVVLMRLSQW